MPNTEDYKAAMDQFLADTAPAMSQEQLAATEKVKTAIGDLLDGGMSANDVVHGALGMLSAMAIRTTIVSREVEVREDLTSCWFDYLTTALRQDVCPDCRYPHEQGIGCEEAYGEFMANKSRPENQKTTSVTVARRLH